MLRKTLHLHYEEHSSNFFREIIAVYTENRTKYINTVCGLSVRDHVNISAGGTCIN
jgi:hypothetical protein